MLSRKHRLSRADFASLRTSRRIPGRFFTLSISPLQAGETKFACVVSKKVSAKAHGRALIKRRTRTACKELAPQALPRHAYVFTAKRPAREADFAEIRAEVAELLAKAGR